MRRIYKRKDSPILQNKWVYKENAAVYNRKIMKALETEQGHFCAYTEERFNAAFARDIEHFNPNLKYTEKDSYKNWFAVSTKFNKEKSTKWDAYQPIMHPTDLNFNKRLWYEDGYYQVNPSDKRAYHLRQYLDLNNEALVQERKNYIDGLEEMKNDIDIENFLRKNPDFIRFPTAIETEFGITL